MPPSPASLAEEDTPTTDVPRVEHLAATSALPANEEEEEEEEEEEDYDDDADAGEEEEVEEEEGGVDVEVMAQMGFTSFGSKPPPKKKTKLTMSSESGGTGGNALPLGQRRAKAGPHTAPPHQNESSRSAGGQASAHPSLPAKPPTPLPLPLPSASRQTTEATQQEGQQQVQHHHHREPGRTRDGTGWDWAQLRRGVRDERGDVGFYDGSFVEDPWAKLVV